MLKLFRNRKGLVRVLFGAIVAMLGAGMLLYLVPTAGSDALLRDPRGNLAQVGPETVTRDEADRIYRRQSEQYGAQSELLRNLIYERAINDLINQRVLEFEAARLGLEASEEDVAARLRRMSTLYPNGQFVGRQEYQRILSEQGLTIPRFEEAVRRQIQVVKLLHWVTDGVSVSPGEIDQAYRDRTERAKLEYVLFRPEDYAGKVQLSEEELRAEYDKNRERYQLPERRILRYVAVDNQVLFQRTAVSASELEAEYQRRLDSYSLPERVHFRHILFLRIPPDSPDKPRDRASLRKLADDALAQIRRGKDFASLAKQLSEDTATKDKGGDAGWVQRGQALPELDQAVFSTGKAGSPPAVVETQIGAHVIQVLEYQPQRVRPLEEVRGEIESYLRQQKVRDLGVKEAKRLVDAVRGGKPLEQAAQEQGWMVRDTAPFARNEAVPGFGPSEDLQDAAFRLPAESAGKPNAIVSDPIPVPLGYVVVKLKQVEPLRVARLDEVRDKVAQSLRAARAGARAQAAAEELAAAAAKTGSLRSAGAALKTSDEFGRFGAVKDIGSVTPIAPLAFSLPIGAVSPAKPVGRNWIVFRVLARQDFDPGRLTPEQRQQIRSGLLEEKRTLAWQVFLESARQRLEAEGVLKINQAAVDRLTGKKS